MFKYDKDIPDPKGGDFLISEPFLPDPNFERSVILVCENNHEGTFGLVLNKSTDILLEDVLEEDVPFRGTLNVGGPVEQNTLHFIHRLSQPIEGSVEIGDGLFWSGNFEQVKALVRSGDADEEQLKFFLGYSGWSEGQLREELDRQSWFVKPTATVRQVFDLEEDALWQSILKDMGGKYKVFSNYPIDPRLN
ncbi:MAG: YqgE/AlgH family protein [Roseivirga sp.]